MENLDFLNLNSIRNYPIKDGLSRISTDGLFTIPNDLIVDLSVSAPGNDHLALYISRVVNTSDNILVEISVVSGSVIGTFDIPVSSPGLTNIQMLASVAYPNSIGFLTVGTTDGVQNLASGEFTFLSSATELLMRVFSPASCGVNYITFVDTKGNQATLTGAVVIQAESNLQFRAQGQSIILDAGENLGLNKQCDQTDTPIKTINGVRPDSEGNFYLVPSACAALEPIEFGLMLSDTCGKPCLGCNEISTLTDRLVSIESELLRVRDYASNLQGMLTQLSTLVNYQCSCE